MLKTDNFKERDQKMDYFSRLRDMKTLLVDDDSLIRSSLNLIFMSKGCFLLAAETAEQGLEAAKKDRFDIIISDFKLPGMDGLEFFMRVAKFQPNTVNILISGYGGNGLASKAAEAGIHHFIKKPFSFETFTNTLLPLVENYGKKTCIEKSDSIK